MIDIKFNCPECKQKLEAPSDMAGEGTECPQCKQMITIPIPPLPPTHKPDVVQTVPVLGQTSKPKMIVWITVGMGTVLFLSVSLLLRERSGEQHARESNTQSAPPVVADTHRYENWDAYTKALRSSIKDAMPVITRDVSEIKRSVSVIRSATKDWKTKLMFSYDGAAESPPIIKDEMYNIRNAARNALNTASNVVHRPSYDQQWFIGEPNADFSSLAASMSTIQSAMFLILVDATSIERALFIAKKEASSSSSSGSSSVSAQVTSLFRLSNHIEECIRAIENVEFDIEKSLEE